MFGTIVLAVDSLPQAERAGALAARLATATGDEVVVVHVLYLSDRPSAGRPMAFESGRLHAGPPGWLTRGGATMRALVVFESMFGNTKVIADAVADGLATRMRVTAVEVGAAPAAFDTRIDKPRLPGSAARAAERRLRRLGFCIAARPASFYVAGTPGPLVAGEPERARQWGEELGALATRGQPARRMP